MNPLLENIDTGSYAPRVGKPYSWIPGGDFVHLESTFQVLKPCHVGMVSPRLRMINNPMNPWSGYHVFQGKEAFLTTWGAPRPLSSLSHSSTPRECWRRWAIAQGSQIRVSSGSPSVSQPQPANRMDAPGLDLWLEPESLWRPGKLGQTSVLGWEIPCSDWVCQPLNDSTLFSQLLSCRPPLRELQLPRSSLPCPLAAAARVFNHNERHLWGP